MGINRPDSPSTSRTILVIEDDESIAMGLEMNLGAEGYRVLVAQDGKSGLQMAREPGIDLIVLDVMLPHINGFEIVRTLRSEQNPVPIILLSARGAEMDKVMGLEIGAEDYITKPFGLAELFARVRAVLRRNNHGRVENSHIRTANLSINTATREVFHNGKPVELTATEFDILLCLIEANGRVIAREEIQSKVWGPTHHGTVRTIDNFILQLRNKLEDDPQAPRHILTVRGLGYRFAS